MQESNIIFGKIWVFIFGILGILVFSGIYFFIKIIEIILKYVI